MSRTDLDPATLARSLRRMAGDPYDSDGGIEWVYEPMQAAVLLDIADALDEIEKLRELVRDMHRVIYVCNDSKCPYGSECIDNRISNLGNQDCKFKRLMRELGIEVDE